MDSVGLARLRKEINLGVEQIERGEYIEVEVDELQQWAENVLTEERQRRDKKAAP